VIGIGQQSGEPGGRGPARALAGQRDLVAGIGVVLSDEGEDGAQVSGPRRAGPDARTERAADTLET